MSRIDRLKAVRLRKLGQSYNQIHQALGTPKSTLSWWFKHEEWSNDVTILNRNKANLKNKENIEKLNRLRSEKLKKHYENAVSEAEKEYRLYKKDNTFIAGLMLYSGEGDKSLENNLVRMANIDFKILKIFFIFLLKFCSVNRAKVKIWLLIYPNLDEEICKKKWSEETGLSYNHFYKTQVISGRHKSRRLPYGVGNIILGDKYLKVKILKWIELLSDDILKGNAGIV